LDWITISAFLSTTFLLLMTPGPVMAVVIGNTLSGGAPSGLRTVLGIGSGEMLLVGGVALSLLASGALLPKVFPWLSLLSALYLVWLALQTVRTRGASPAGAVDRRACRPFINGLLVTLSSPTAPMFYAAFLLPFIDGGAAMASQLWVLAMTYLIASLSFDIGCVLLVSRLRMRPAIGPLSRAAPIAMSAVYLGTSAAALHAFLDMRP